MSKGENSYVHKWKPRQAPSYVTWVLSFGVTLFVAGFKLQDSSKSSEVLAPIFFAIGLGMIAHWFAKYAEVVCGNLWPEREERQACGVLWTVARIHQIKDALQRPRPAEEITKLFDDHPSMKRFASSDILEAIKNMHKGAFLAAIHCWGPDGFNESIMRRGDPDKMDNLQRGIADYRSRVADSIAKNHLLAARRYRVNEADTRSFLGRTGGQERFERLCSLLELAFNMRNDFYSGWYVDVEFYRRGLSTHNPNLDYALLFGANERVLPYGAQAVDRAGESAIPRVAFVTASADELKKEEDYIGIAIADPAVVAFLMEDRSRSSPSLETSDEFLKTIVPLVRDQMRILKQNGYTGSVDADYEVLLQKLSEFNDSMVALVTERNDLKLLGDICDLAADIRVSQGTTQ
jgi:hypothetical protein